MKLSANGRLVLSSLLAALGLSATSCVSIPDSNPNYDKFFEGKQGCFLLYDLSSKTYVDSFNPEFCKLQKPALSTFKVPLAVMGLDAGVLKDENSTFKWNGEIESIESWNHDQNATTWIANSVIWYSQRITKALGRPKIQSYLEAFEYGNENFSGKIDSAWLTIAPFIKGEPKPTLLISPIEQVGFLEKFWTFRLPAKRSAIDTAQKMMYIEENLKGYKLSGKTGSGYLDKSFTRRLGWFVAHLETRNKRYIAVLDFEDSEEQGDRTPGGAEAKNMLLKILSRKNLY